MLYQERSHISMEASWGYTNDQAGNGRQGQILYKIYLPITTKSFLKFTEKKVLSLFQDVLAVNEG